MDHMADVVIVSAFGRGNWLAMELATRGWKVTFVDVTGQMGEWEPEDAEGPFGLFDVVAASQKSRLMDEGECRPVPQGWTLWLSSGPVECGGELTRFQLEKRGISESVEAYLRYPTTSSSASPSVSTDRAWDRESERGRRALLNQPFEKTWFAHLTHQLASTVIRENHLSLERGWPLPVFSPFLIRQATRKGWQKGLAACQAAGVKVRANASIRDLRLNGRLVDAIEVAVAEERSGVERGRSFVWMLSSLETKRFPESVQTALFPEGAVEPDWFWARFQVDLRGRVFDDQIPLHAVLLEDPFLPWTHVNLMVMRKRAGGHAAIDVWMRLPAWARFDGAYLEGVRVEMERVLETRLPQAEPRTSMPAVESRLPEAKLGAPRFPVYEKKKLARLKELSAKNLFFDGPEHWTTLDWLGQYRHQATIFAGLEKLKVAWEAAALKAGGLPPTNRSSSL